MNVRVSNGLYATTFDVNEEHQLALAKIAKELGVEIFVIDDGKKQQPGTYTERRDKVEQIDATAFLNADYKIGEDIALNGMIGWNLNQQTSSYLKSYLYGLEQPGWFNLANGVDKPMTTTYSDNLLFGPYRVYPAFLVLCDGGCDGTFIDRAQTYLYGVCPADEE